jgi:signal recognition particle GTPase
MALQEIQMILIDTAGRLQANKAHPDELSKKLKKVSKKVIPDAP